MFSTTDLNSLHKVTSITRLFSVTGLDGTFAALLTFSIGRDVLDHLPNFQFSNVSQLGMLLMKREKGNISRVHLASSLVQARVFSFFFCTLVLNKELLYVIYENVILPL